MKSDKMVNNSVAKDIGIDYIFTESLDRVLSNYTIHKQLATALVQKKHVRLHIETRFGGICGVIIEIEVRKGLWSKLSI
jgi:hypothetical protein